MQVFPLHLFANCSLSSHVSQPLFSVLSSFCRSAMVRHYIRIKKLVLKTPSLFPRVNIQASIGAREKKMPAKEDSSEKEKSLDLFLKIGLDERTARNTIANNKVTTNLIAVIHEAGVTDGCSRSVGNLIYTVATKYPGNALPHRPTLLQYVVSSKVKTTAQLDAALSFLATTGNENLDLNKFEEACGVGVEVSTEDIKHAVNGVFEENKASILELRYRTNGICTIFPSNGTSNYYLIKTLD